MSNQFNEMEYFSVDGGTQDVDMLDVDSEQPMQDGPSPYAGREGQCFQSSRINIAPSEGHVDHARASPITEHSFLTVTRLLTIVGWEMHVPQELRFLESIEPAAGYRDVYNRNAALSCSQDSALNGLDGQGIGAYSTRIYAIQTATGQVITIFYFVVEDVSTVNVVFLFLEPERIRDVHCLEHGCVVLSDGDGDIILHKTHESEHVVYCLRSALGRAVGPRELIPLMVLSLLFESTGRKVLAGIDLVKVIELV